MGITASTVSHRCLLFDNMFKSCANSACLFLCSRQGYLDSLMENYVNSTKYVTLFISQHNFPLVSPGVSFRVPATLGEVPSFQPISIQKKCTCSFILSGQLFTINPLYRKKMCCFIVYRIKCSPQSR